MPNSESEPGSDVAAAEPPAPPEAPPPTSTAAPGPSRRRRLGCLIAALAVALLIAAAGGGAYTWLHSQAQPPATVTPREAEGAVASALRKAEVDFPGVPSAKVDLRSIKAEGSHHFDATFTYEELVALLATFSYTPKSAKGIGLAVSSITPSDDNDLRVYGDITTNGMTLSGWLEGPVRFADGKIQATGDFTANTGGIPLGGGQATRTANMAIKYLNAYLAAAPGLEVESAVITPDGIHATGTAADKISW